MKRNRRPVVLSLLLGATLGGCSTNVDVGLNVGVPIGNYGYMSVGTGRWF